MVYDLKDALDKESFTTRVKYLQDKQTIVELTEKEQRTLSQSAYCHVIIAYFALQFGYSSQEVKDFYFKETVNPDIFVRTRQDKILGIERKYLRSTADISKEEMSVAIDRFLSWASSTAGIYIPSAEEHKAVVRMQYEVERAKRYMTYDNKATT